MLHIVTTKMYKKSFNKLLQSGKFDLKKVNFVIDKIANREKLPEKYKDHKLKGELSEYRECHIQPDLLLIYQIKDRELILVLVNIGSHSDLF